MTITRTLMAVGTLAIMWVGLSSGAFGQRGMGDADGIARQADKPEIVQLAGTIRAVKTQPCEKTTGRSEQGTHVVLETPSGDELDIHLGPAAKVGKIVEKLAVDQQVKVAAFRTDKLPKDAYVAQILTVDDKTIELRDKDLRPVWAGRGARQLAGRGPQKGRGKGRWSAGQGADAGGSCAMCGRGQGQGRGAGMGRGQGQGQQRGCAGGSCGRGRGQGRGAGMGRGQGQGRGRGAGRGRGQGRGWDAQPNAEAGDAVEQKEAAE